MPTYVYSCPDCHQELEYGHPMSETDVPTWCGPCGCREMSRVPLGGAQLLIKGSPLKERALRREFVVQNRDGSESVYRSQEQAYRAELERTGNAATARYNARYLERMGYVPGTEAAQRAEALDAAPGGRAGSSVVT